RTLTESEGRYRSLVDALPEAVFVHRDALLFVNEAAVRLAGARSAEQLIGRSVFSFAAEADRPRLIARMQTILEQRVAAPRIELLIRRLDGAPMWVEVQGVPIVFEGEPAVQSVLHDITARREQKDADDARAARIQHQSDMLLQFASHQGAGWHGLQSALDEISAQACEVMHADRAAIWVLRDETFHLTNHYGHARAAEVAAFGGVSAAASRGALQRERVIESSAAADDARTRELLASGLVSADAKSFLAAAIRRSGELAGVITFEWVDRNRSGGADEVSFVGGV